MGLNAVAVLGFDVVAERFVGVAAVLSAVALAWRLGDRAAHGRVVQSPSLAVALAVAVPLGWPPAWSRARWRKCLAPSAPACSPSWPPRRPRPSWPCAWRITTSAVNQHLRALRAAGLLVSARHGRSVLYRRSDTAGRLLAAAGAAGGPEVVSPADGIQRTCY